MKTLWRLCTGTVTTSAYGGRSRGIGCNPRIVMGLLIIVGYLAYNTTIEKAEDNLRAIAQGIATDTSSLLTDIDQGLIALSSLGDRCEPCQRSQPTSSSSQNTHLKSQNSFQ